MNILLRNANFEFHIAFYFNVYIPQAQSHAAAYYFSNQLAQLIAGPHCVTQVSDIMPAQWTATQALGQQSRAATADAATAMSKPQ